MSQVLFIIALAGGFLIPTIIFKQWRLFWVFMIFFICFGLCEWLSVVQTGKTISQHFWYFDEGNPAGGWWIVGGMAVGWIALLLHFKLRKQK
jgi:hypothetical protein